MTIANSIKHIRLARGFSQEQLAIKSGLAQNVISRIERAQHAPNDKTIAKLAEALEVDAEVFQILAILYESESTKFRSIKEEIAPFIEKEINKLYDLDTPSK